MEEKQNFSFCIKAGEDYKSRSLIYEEPGYKLVAYIEMSGVRQFDWVACDTEFLKWTIPEEMPIPEEKRREILSHLNDWCKKKGVRINISPPLDMKKMFYDYEKKGYKVAKLADGSTKVFFPKRSIWWNMLQIIIALVIFVLIAIILNAVISVVSKVIKILNSGEF